DGDATSGGGPGYTVLTGENGFDYASYTGATAADANLSTGLATAAGRGDTLSGIEGLIGSPYNDTLTGDSGPNALAGGDGNDVLTGNAGGDFLYGGDATDTISE